MKKIKVKSSNISSIGYDVKEKILEIQFKNKTTYLYYEVPLNIWQGFKNAFSKGKYCHQKIRGRYSYKKK